MKTASASRKTMSRRCCGACAGASARSDICATRRPRSGTNYRDGVATCPERDIPYLSLVERWDLRTQSSGSWKALPISMQRRREHGDTRTHAEAGIADIELVRVRIDGKRVGREMGRDQIEIAIEIRPDLRGNAYIAGQAGGVDAPETGIEGDAIRSETGLQRLHRAPVFQIKHHEQRVLAANDEGTAICRIDGETGWRLAGPHCPSAHDAAFSEINGRQFVCALDVLIDET